jgi:hypothetical protein
MEIIETGALRRVDAERTEDVAVVQLFEGIYGVGKLSYLTIFVPLICPSKDNQSHTVGIFLAVALSTISGKERGVSSCPASKKLD